MISARVAKGRSDKGIEKVLDVDTALLSISYQIEYSCAVGLTDCYYDFHLTMDEAEKAIQHLKNEGYYVTMSDNRLHISWDKAE